jgi:hypothetical protein
MPVRRTMTLYSAHCLGCGRRIQFPWGEKPGELLKKHREYSDGPSADNPWCNDRRPQPDTVEARQQEYMMLSFPGFR